MKARALLPVLPLVLAACSRAPSGPVLTPVRAAKDQAEAIRLAREEDLPALASADRAVVTEARSGRKVTVDRPVELETLRRALITASVPPSAGETAWEVRFFQGDRLIREVWVYPYGEWGFVRPEPPSWTVGSAPGLVEVIRKLLG
jgi:hypothetical protein